MNPQKTSPASGDSQGSGNATTGDEILGNGGGNVNIG